MFFSQIIIWIESKNWNFPNFFKNGFKISFSIIYQWLLRNNNCWESCSRRSKELIFSQFSQHDRINQWPNITLSFFQNAARGKGCWKACFLNCWPPPTLANWWENKPFWIIKPPFSSYHFISRCCKPPTSVMYVWTHWLLTLFPWTLQVWAKLMYKLRIDSTKIPFTKPEAYLESNQTYKVEIFWENS